MPRLDRPVAPQGEGRAWRSVTLVGTLCRTPELRFLSRGTAVLNLHVRTDHGGEVEVEVFGSQAVNAATCLELGHRVIACGRLYGRRRVAMRAFEIARSLAVPDSAARTPTSRDPGSTT